MNLPKTLLLVFITNISFVATSDAQKIGTTVQAWREAGRPAIRNFTPKEYGEFPQNYAIVQDNRGMIYAANLSGVLEFDGVSWRKITTTKGSWVLSLAKDGNGTVFVGAFGDFGYLSPDTVGRLQFTSPLDRVEPADRDFAEVWRTHCTNNAVYFWTRNIIFRWSMNSFTAWRSDSAYALSSVFQDTLYVERRGSGLLKLVGDSLTVIADSKKLSPLGMIEMLPYDNRTPLVAFNVEGRNPVELAEALNDAGIESRAGCHCATLAHHSLGLTPPASCRLSFYFYNEMNDVESATSTLALIVRKNPIPRGLVA